MVKNPQDKIKICQIINCNSIAITHLCGKDLCGHHKRRFHEQSEKWNKYKHNKEE